MYILYNEKVIDVVYRNKNARTRMSVHLISKSNNYKEKLKMGTIIKQVPK